MSRLASSSGSTCAQGVGQRSASLARSGFRHIVRPPPANRRRSRIVRKGVVPARRQRRLVTARWSSAASRCWRRRSPALLLCAEEVAGSGRVRTTAFVLSGRWSTAARACSRATRDPARRSPPAVRRPLPLEQRPHLGSPPAHQPVNLVREWTALRRTRRAFITRPVRAQRAADRVRWISQRRASSLIDTRRTECSRRSSAQRSRSKTRPFLVLIAHDRARLTESRGRLRPQN